MLEPFGGLVIDASGNNTGALNHTAAANNGLTFGPGSGEGIASARSGTANAGGLDLYTNYAKQLSVTNSGKVGIGISGPGAKLHVVDNATFDPTSIPFNHVLIGHSRPFSGVEGSGFCSSGSSSGNPMCMTVNNSHITWSQVLSTGTGQKMDLDLAQGNLLIGGTLTQNSSAAFKKDITWLDAEAMEHALQLVKDTPIATYRYKTMSDDTKVVYGVIAEKTPSALLAQDDKGVNLSTTIGVLMASVKAQQAHIEQLEARLAKFELAKKQR